MNGRITQTVPMRIGLHCGALLRQQHHIMHFSYLSEQPHVSALLVLSLIRLQLHGGIAMYGKKEYQIHPLVGVFGDFASRVVLHGSRWGSALEQSCVAPALVPSGPQHTSTLGPSPGLAEADWGLLHWGRRGGSNTKAEAVSDCLQVCVLHLYISIQFNFYFPFRALRFLSFTVT